MHLEAKLTVIMTLRVTGEEMITSEFQNKIEEPILGFLGRQTGPPCIFRLFLVSLPASLSNRTRRVHRQSPLNGQFTTATSRRTQATLCKPSPKGK